MLDPHPQLTDHSTQIEIRSVKPPAFKPDVIRKKNSRVDLHLNYLLWRSALVDTVRTVNVNHFIVQFKFHLCHSDQFIYFNHPKLGHSSQSKFGNKLLVVSTVNQNRL